MAERSFPLENTVYNAEEAALWFATRTSGVYANDELKVKATGGMFVAVEAGIAWLAYKRFAGVAYGNTEEKALAIPTANATMPRIDRIVVRYSSALNGVVLAVLSGTPSASPIPPTLRRTENIYEISLAQVYVGAGATEITAANITDERLNNDVCGLMRDGVTRLQTEELKGDKGDQGEPGASPYIGGNGNWFVYDDRNKKYYDTGFAAEGVDGKDGQPGADGVSPTLTVSTITGGHKITIKDASGTKSVDVLDGKDGQDGEDGHTPVKGVDYVDGKDGKDGVGIETVIYDKTPDENGVVHFTIQLTDGRLINWSVQNGEDGADGSPGADGVGIASVKQTTTSSADGGNNVVTVTLTNGASSTFTVKNGSKGSPGSDGDDGVGIASAVLNEDYTLTLSFTNGTKYTTPSIRGATGATGATGGTGATGQRGTGILKITTAPSGYTTATGGFTPTYRVSLSTVKTQSKVSNVLVGDVIQYSYYQYPVGYVDSSYVYLGTRTSLRGATGEAGSDATVTAANITAALGYTPADAANVDNVPDYVVTEADSVVDRVIAAQGKRTFTFAAITDMHYGNGSYTDGVLHACQAMKYIDERIKLDAVAVLGDYTDGYPADGLANAIGDFKAINAVLDALRFAPNLRQQGNHDFYAGNAPITNRFIQSYSTDVVWGDRIGGYYYRDFDSYKLRVISLNTVETGNANIDCTTAQVQWFANTLDLSAKSDAKDWQILVLSHHPLDWYYKDESNYAFAKIVDAYSKGGSYSAGGVSYNYAGKNKTVLIGNIHGHIHNLLVDKIHVSNTANGVKSSVYRMATPEACINRANQYTGAWKEATSYPKTTGTADDTSFVVYCIDLDTYTINAICYGAGYDRNLIYAAQTTYSVKQNLTNITSSNMAANVVEGAAFTTVLTPANGNTLDSITVTMGGSNITSSVLSGYTITIPAVTGDVVITATASVHIVNLIDDAGYTNGKRFSTSSGSETNADGCMVTGYMEVGEVGTVYRTYGVDFTRSDYPNQGVYVAYDGNKAVLGKGYLNNNSYCGPFYVVHGSDGNITLTVDRSHNDADAVYFRIGGYGSGANLIVTRNQEIS